MVTPEGCNLYSEQWGGRGNEKILGAVQLQAFPEVTAGKNLSHDIQKIKCFPNSLRNFLVQIDLESDKIL